MKERLKNILEINYKNCDKLLIKKEFAYCVNVTKKVSYFFEHHYNNLILTVLFACIIVHDFFKFFEAIKFFLY